MEQIGLLTNLDHGPLYGTNQVLTDFRPDHLAAPNELKPGGRRGGVMRVVPEAVSRPRPPHRIH